MKEKELRESAKCGVCGRLIGETGLPLFYRVKIERFGIDLAAVNRLQGLTMILGGNALVASAMSPDDEFAKPLMDPVTVTVCEACSMTPVYIPVLAGME